MSGRWPPLSLFCLLLLQSFAGVRTTKTVNGNSNTLNLALSLDHASNNQTTMADCVRIDNTVQLYAHECRGGFDFPLLFEESILILLPVLSAVFIAIVRSIALLRSPVTTASAWIAAPKAVGLIFMMKTCEQSADSDSSFPGSVSRSSISPLLECGLHLSLPVRKPL